MSALLAIATREFTAAWRTSTGWIVAAIFALAAGLVLSATTLAPSNVATMRAVFSTAHWILLIAAPAISMRLVAEESRSGSLETLLASPAQDLAIAAGKFLGALATIAVLLLTTIPALIVLAVLAPIDPGPLLAGYTGVILASGLYLAVGLACSALTDSQVTAFLATVFLMAIWNAGAALAPTLNVPLLTTVGDHLSIATRLETFARGLIDTGDIVFFLSAWWVGIAVTAAALSWRRWA